MIRFNLFFSLPFANLLRIFPFINERVLTLKYLLVSIMKSNNWYMNSHKKLKLPYDDTKWLLIIIWIKTLYNTLLFSKIKQKTFHDINHYQCSKTTHLWKNFTYKTICLLPLSVPFLFCCKSLLNYLFLIASRLQLAINKNVRFRIVKEVGEKKREAVRKWCHNTVTITYTIHIPLCILCLLDKTAMNRVVPTLDRGSFCIETFSRYCFCNLNVTLFVYPDMLIKNPSLIRN